MPMATDASSSLSDDIQRALQQAVGDVNDAANVAKKKHKRPHNADNDHADEAGDKVVKKKKKSHRSTEGQADSSVVAQPAAAFPAPLIASDILSLEGGEKKRKKQKEKGKEREQNIAEPPPPDVLSSTELSASSLDFISAVVAAASATSDQPPPGHTQYDQHMPPPFMEYPHDFGAYPYSLPSQPTPFGHPPPLYPDPNAEYALPDLNFTSSEDLLRSIQDFDLNKVVSVLRSLGEAANTSNITLNAQPAFMQPVPPPLINQNPARSDAILGRPPQQKKAPQPVVPQVHNNAPPPLPLAPLEQDNPEHAHMLANVWMNAAKLSDMVKKEGLVYKKGKFSAIEEAQLTAAIENYRSSRGLDEDQFNDLIFAKGQGRQAFWSEITSALHLRPIIAVYHHVRRTYHPLKQQGKWMKSEDDLLRDAVKEMGQQWERVSRIVGRMSSDCRDRYRNHIQDSELRISDFLGVVSQRMGNRRGRQQCRIKWTDSLSTQIKNMGERPRWSQMDAYILVHKIDSMNVRDDSEIDWKLLPDEHWNVWSAHSLQRRWTTMKRGIKGYEEMSHAEVMEILRTKKAQSPPPPSSARKKKSKVTSNEAVVDVDDMEMLEAVQPLAGPSNGRGTLA
ncbi:hypothetical protein B0H21DRAFT_740145 [Amylocystis lapponica]|nr:hypothetical protein B0H21DRAFT_740145 [Amylocystis lapponica]